MKISNLFGKTMRDDPSEAETAGHKLLLKAGFVQPLASGIYSFMPMAFSSAGSRKAASSQAKLIDMPRAPARRPRRRPRL